MFLSFSETLLFFVQYLIALTITFFIGRPLISNHFKSVYTTTACSLITGLIIISCFFSVFITKGNTQLLLLTILPFILLYYRKGKWKLVFNLKVTKQNICYVLLITSTCFFYNYILRLPVIENEIFFMFDDFANYSKISIDFLKYGNENIYYDSLFTVEKHNPYHYLEIWYNSFFSNIFSANHYLFYVYNLQAIFLTITFFLILGISKELIFSNKQIFFASFIPFLTSIPPFFNYLNLPWFMELNQRNLSIIHYYNCQPIYIFLLATVFVFLKKSKKLGLILFSFTALINPLFIGIVPLTLLSLLIFENLTNKNTVRFKMKEYFAIYSYIIVPIIISFSIIIGLKVIGLDFGEAEGKNFNMKFFLIAGNIFLRSILNAVIYCPIYLLGYILILKSNNFLKATVKFLIIFLLASLLFYSLFYQQIGGDIVQIIFNSWNIVLITFGWLFLIYSIPKNKPKTNKVLIPLILINLIFSLWNTFSEKFSSYGPVYAWNQHNVKKMDLDDYNKLKYLISELGTNGGYIIKDSSHTRGLHISDLNFLLSIDNKINTYRLNSTMFDQNNFSANKILNQSFFNGYHNQEQNDRNQILVSANRLKVNWIFVDSTRYIFPVFLRMHFPNKHTFKTFNIYSK